MQGAAPADAPTHPTFLSLDDKAWRDFPKAPAPGSAVDDTDLLITLQAQATRTEAQKAEATTDEHYTIKLLTGVIDPDFETKYPATFKLLETVNLDGFFIMKKLKKANARLRPYVGHPTLVTPLFPCEGFSYPSGHASGAELMARELSVLFPDKADDLHQRARQVADGRVVAGVHYASDIAEGEILGDIEANRLAASAKFQQALHDAAKQDGIALK